LEKELAQFATNGNESPGECEEGPSRTKIHRCDGGESGRQFLNSKWTLSDTSASTNQTKFLPIDPDEWQTTSGNEDGNLLQIAENQENLDIIIDMEQSEDETKSTKNNSTASRRS
jgi:hypothetical protein